MSDQTVQFLFFHLSQKDLRRVKKILKTQFLIKTAWIEISPATILTAIMGNAILLADASLANPENQALIDRIRQANPELPILILNKENTKKFAEVLNRAGLSHWLAVDPGDEPAIVQFLRLALKQVRASYSESEDHFSRLFQTNPTPLILTQPENGLIIDANQAYAAMVGYQREEIVGKTTLEMGLFANPRDREELVQTLKRDGRVVNQEIRYNTRIRGTRILLASIELVPFKDRKYMLSAAQDITERKKYEEELMRNQSYLEHAQRLAGMGHWSYEVASKKITWSDELYRVYDIDKKNEIDLEEFYSRIHPEDRKWVREVNARIKDDGRPFDIEYRIITRAGEEKRLREIANAVVDEKGKVIELFGIDQDLTEIKTLQFNLQERVKELTCLFKASSLMQSLQLSEEEILRQVTDLLPPAMQFPQIAAARLEFDGKTYHSGKSKKTGSGGDLYAGILLNGEERGRLAVCYTKEKPFIIPEEQNLIDNLARMLGQWLESKRSLDALRSSEQNYHDTLENLLEGIQILDFDCHYVFMNAEAEKHARRSRSELIGHTMLEKYPGIEESELYRKINDCLVYRKPSKMENEFAYPDGEVRWFELSIEPNPVGVLIHSMDITERKKVQKDLNESNARYRLISEHSDDVIWVLDVESMKFVYVSPSVYKLRGFTPEEVLRQPIEEVLAAESIPVVQSLLAGAIADFQQGKSVESGKTEIIQICKDGSAVLTEAVTNLVMNEQGKLQVIGISRDISERKKAEKQIRESEVRFRQIAENIREVFWMVDRAQKNRFSYVSPVFEDILGISINQLDQDIKDFLLLIHPDDRPAFNAVMKKQASGIPTEMEYRIIRQDGSIRWLNDRSFPVFDKDGKLIRTTGIAMEITERKMQDEQLSRRAEDLNLLNKINQARNKGESLKSIMDIVSVELRRIFNCIAVLVCLPDESGSYLQLTNLDIPRKLARNIEGLVSDKISRLSIRIPLTGEGYFATLARGDQGAIVSEDQHIRAIMREFTDKTALRKMVPAVHRLLDIHSSIMQPLRSAEKLVGFIVLDRSIPFGPDDLRRVNMIAAEFTTAVARHQIDLALQASEEQYRGLIESMDNVVALVDRDGRFVFMNDVAARSFGQKAETLTGKTVRELFGESSASQQLKSVRQVFETDRGMVVESPIEIAGRVEWYRTSLQPIHDADGKIKYALVNSLNINKLKTAQAELLELNRTLEERVQQQTAEVKDLYERAPSGYHSLNAEGKFVMVNQTELDWLGYTLDELIGQPIQKIFTPESVATFRANFPIFLHQGWIKDREFELVRKDGSTFPTLVSATAIYDANGKYLMSRSTVVDITDLKKAQSALTESQQRLQNFLDTASDLIQVMDTQGKFIYVNNAWCQTLGYSTEEVQYQSFYQILDPFYTDSVRKVLQKLAITQEPQQIEVILKTKSGEQVFVEGSFVARKESSGVVNANGIFRNVTSRRQAEIALRQSRDDLRAANAALEKAAKMKDEFLASMSHELRTPLTGVLGLSEVLKLGTYGELNEKQQNALASIEESGRHLLALINDILDLSKIEAERLDLQFEECSVSEICQSSLQLVKGMAQRKSQNVNFSANPLSASVYADPRRLKQILVNLLSNAIKFTPEKGSLGLEVEGDEQSEVIRFSVWDKGIGIQPDDLQRLFQPFVQLDSRLSREQSGTGLGLSLVARLTELHGGSVSVESQPGQGSRFGVSLPWKKVEIIQEDHKPTENLSINRCFLIEDNDVHSRQIGGYLSKLGIEWQVYKQGQGALEAAAEYQPDVILLDLKLPDRPGGEVLMDLRHDPRTRDVVVIISSVEEDRSRYIGMGAAGYLVKPFTLEDLKNEFQRVLAYPLQPRASTSHPDRKLILVADDNEVTLNTLCDYLSSQSFKVYKARNGQELVNLAASLKPHLILADVQMPGMDGLEATRRIRAHLDPEVARIPILAVTALAMSGDREKCLQAGANDYLSKPVRLAQLSEIVEAWLGHQQGKKVNDKERHSWRINRKS